METLTNQKMDQIINQFNLNYSIVKVTFNQNYNPDVFEKLYTYKCAVEGVKEGDFVVVDTPNEGFRVVKVVSIIENSYENAIQANKASKFIVDKVDMTKYNESKELKEKRRWILNQLAERKKVLEELAVFEAMALKDDQSKELLEQLKGTV